MVGIVVGTIKEGQQLNFAVSLRSVKAAYPLGFPVNRGVPILDGDAETWVRLTKTPFAKGLSDTSDFSILIGDLDPALARTISRETLQTWIEAAILKFAPNAAVVTSAYSAKRFSESNPPANLVDAIKRNDAFGRHLYLNVGFLRDDLTDVSTYMVNLQFNRLVATADGTTLATVWDTGRLGYFGTAINVEEKLRATITDMVRKFAEAWNNANKPPDK